MFNLVQIKISEAMILAVVFFAIGCHSATAYEITTHALITEVAEQRSVLNPSNPNSIFPDLGFDRLAINTPFRADHLPPSAVKDAYYDDAAVSQPNLPPLLAAHTRFLQQQEREPFDSLIQRRYIVGDPTTSELETRLDGWLMRGTIREDDNDVLLYGVWTVGDDRDEDPYGPILRALRHFYDPAKDRSYSFISQCAVYGCVKSILWAIGTTDPLNPGNDTVDLARRNHFTWQDARNNYWWALTLERTTGSMRSSSDRFYDSQERKWRWATAVKSVGHVVHLLQDAAQPQHTRNDAHAPPRARFSSDELPNEGEADAAYEAYTDYRVTADYSTANELGGLPGNPLRYMDEGVPAPSQIVNVALGNYPNVSFSTPIKYFTTRHVDTTPTSCGPGSPTVNVACARRGMADYSNRGFFTSGTVPGMRECVNPGPGANPCTVYATGPTYPMPEEAFNSNDWESFALPSDFYVDGKVVRYTDFARTVPDNIAPSHDSALLAKYHGKVPIMTQGVFANVLDLLPPDQRTGVDQTLRYNNMQYDADVLIPRAIGYTAGIINFFFRGRLDVLPPNNRVVGVLNQGSIHTMNSAGYPCQGASVLDDCAIFGFEKIRVRLRNSTPDITESGTGTVVAQNTGGTGSQLVAIARYHRNACYKPDLSGERAQSYAPPPQLVIAEPVCDAAHPVRTAYQEISVSAPLAVTIGELDVVAGAEVEKMFDFSNDPIPVNATDLFIQVAYRGSMGDSSLGTNFVEFDSIAVGMLDVREPTFVTYWNNTDYWWNGGGWLPHSATYPFESARDFWVCAGGSPVKLVFSYQGASGAPAMMNPISGSGQSGIVRLGFVFPPPDAGIPGQRKAIRGVPVEYPIAGHKRIPLRSIFTSGAFRQANNEMVEAATLAAPYDTCAAGLPTAAEYWCFDPIQKRRAQLMGAPAQPMYLQLVATNDAADVDSVSLPAFAGVVPLATGDLRFNTDTTLSNCPAQPTAVGDMEAEKETRRLELLEEAADLGIEP